MINTQLIFDGTGTGGVSTLGNFVVNTANSKVLGPYSRQLEVQFISGALFGTSYRWTLHFDLAWNNPNPIFALPIESLNKRLDGINLNFPGDPLLNGLWQ